MTGRKSSRRPRAAAPERPEAQARLRIIGGRFRGRRLLYSGDPRTRPMKDRVRQAVFDLLGPMLEGVQAIDLFAGTGALGLEALSRGAAGATFIEQHVPTARVIEANIAALGVAGQCVVIAGSAFAWARHASAEQPGDRPWLVFCSPPYDFYEHRRAEMLSLLASLRAQAPPHSRFVVEADTRFDFQLLAPLGVWDVRPYPPAVIGLHACA